MSAASVTRRLSVVKGFYKYMLNAGILTENRAADVKASGFERKTPDILSRTEVEKLLAQPDITDPKGIRDRAMLEVMYATGMRVTELLDLRISDYVPRTKTIICSSAKRPRSFELYPIAAKCLGDYLKNSRQSFIKQSSDCVYIFINFNGERMTRQGFWKLLKYYAEASGISNQISPHTLRHSFATHLLENGAEPRDVQELLGNRDGAAVKEYLNYIKSKAMGKAIKHHPRA
ncbi:Tyrosine recombinase XerD [bioreactor metagenome]|uniref:Tyrosine recombinase XerD n=1 Tax=bioreactor metagenome TaxID=1076179 RepID=A0A645EY45_9ZZZZ